MDYENNYRELRATITGRSDAYQSFLSGQSEEDTQHFEVTRNAKAALEELQHLLKIIEKHERQKI